MLKKVYISLGVSVVLFPLFLLLILSFGKQWSYPHIIPKEFSLVHWISVFQLNSTLPITILKSLVISLSVATIVTAVSFFSAKHVSYSVHRKKWLFLAYIPYVCSPVIFAATLQFYFTYTDLSGTMLGIIIAQLFITYPFGVIIFSNFWNDNIKSIEQLSTTLGSSPVQTFQKVVFPLSKSVLLLCFFQVFLISWFEYGLTTLIGVGKVKTLTISVFQYIQEANLFLAALASCLLVIPPMLLLFINKRFVFTNQQIG
ncbi:ABC transporter permease [Aquimarina algicola]|uniref:ABC transporter permease subunit n=1 Tax=Aquimarina algicola TaxID=2589995 RepID=A0A504JEW7_9FLAO|nr:ABC transporter permease subunit [Aquimarina algicola]TPN87242.1 ABC transporter permease subunit [Aquimarina algicola]